MAIIGIKRKVNIVSAGSNVVILSTALQDTETSFANQKITLPRVLAYFVLPTLVKKTTPIHGLYEHV